MKDLAEELARLHSAVSSYGEAAGPFDVLMRKFMMRSLEPYFVDGNCLQIGCAHGDQTSQLLERFPSVTVLEPVEAFIADAKARVDGRAQFVQGLIETFDTHQRFSNIVFSHVIEHVVDPVDCVRRLGCLLAPGGRLFIVAPNAEAPSRRIAVKMGLIGHLEALSAADVAVEHRRVYRMDTLLHDVAQSRLGVVAYGGIFYKPLANFQFDALIGTSVLSDDYLEGCYQLGLERPSDCASLYVVAQAV